MARRRLLLWAIPASITVAGQLYVQFAPQDAPIPQQGYAILVEREGGAQARCQQDLANGTEVCLTEVRTVPLPAPQDRDDVLRMP